MGTEQAGVVQVAVAAPLRRLFDYRSSGGNVRRGVRVRVPFGHRTLIGVVISNHPPQSQRQLKSIDEVLDTRNLFGEKLLDLVIWAANYYHHSLGEALQTALPVQLRKGKPLTDPTQSQCIRAISQKDYSGRTADYHDRLERAPVQAEIYRYLVGANWVQASIIQKQFPASSNALKRLQEKGLVEIALRSVSPSRLPEISQQSDNIKLNSEQQNAAHAINDCAGRFGAFLLHGITGSGKTEVYLEAAQQCIANGTQVLILVPEIALTPQLICTVRARLGDNVCVLHSALSAEQRYRAWWQARTGQVVAVLGTRLAVFTPLKSPGLIVVDEEHDISYKQQNGFRYHARDLAIKRASMENIPIILGSATPSMETYHNVRQGRYQTLRLGSRARHAKLPRIGFINLTQHRSADGLSIPLLQAIKQRLSERKQSIIFLNRRGFAPLAQCLRCKWQVGCTRCDTKLTYHRDLERFQCHHCGQTSKAELTCGACGAPIFLIGVGTQRLQSALKEKFPEARISRLDRDQITTQKKLESELEAIRLGKTDIIIGTQLIAKGHDFSQVTLVGVVDSDQGLYSIDFRALEYLFQQLTQVSGRAGRAKSPGEVLIQTAHPQHPIFQHIQQHDFTGFADHCLAERHAANYPPFSYIALWRAESTQQTTALKFLQHTATVGKRMLEQQQRQTVQIMDAVVSPIEKLAGRYRAQLMVRSTQRGALHQLLGEWIKWMENDPQSRRARWSLDVDPVDMFDPVEIF